RLEPSRRPTQISRPLAPDWTSPRLRRRRETWAPPGDTSRALPSDSWHRGRPGMPSWPLRWRLSSVSRSPAHSTCRERPSSFAPPEARRPVYRLLDIDRRACERERDGMALASPMLLAMPFLLSLVQPVSTRPTTPPAPSAAQDAIVVLQETRTPEP